MLSRTTILVTLLIISLAASSLYFMKKFSYKLSHPESAIAITELKFQASDSEQPPAVASQWQAVSLPDDWHYSQRTGVNGWYLYQYNIEVAPNRLWGIYLPTVQHNAAVYLNNELLGSGGSFTEPVSRNWNRPLYFAIPNGLIRPGINTINIRLKSYPVEKGLLAEVYLGPAKFLQPVYQSKYFYRYTLSQFIIIILVFTCILMVMLWSYRSEDTIYGWYALAILVWTIHNLNLVVIDIPFSVRIWDWLMFVSMIWFPVFSTSFIQRYIGVLNKQIEKLSFVVAAFCSMLLFFLPEDSFYWVGTRVTDTLALTFGLYPIYRLFRYLLQNPMQETYLFMLTGFILITFGFNDWLIVNYYISRETGFFMHYSAPPGLILFAYILLKRFVTAMNETEHLNRNLESQVAKKHAELEQSYDTLKKLDKQSTLVEERERLMRDMHDGMGGHLISTLALLETEKVDNSDIRLALQTALDDLRLMIDSMEDVDGDVLYILAMLRERLEPRLNLAGIKINWQVDELTQLPALGPEKSLHLLRIFQEAITNVLKHSRADTLTFNTRLETNKVGQVGVQIECSDNGKGFSEQPGNSTQIGRGLKNIKRRADHMGGIAGIENITPTGVKVWLWLPH